MCVSMQSQHMFNSVYLPEKITCRQIDKFCVFIKTALRLINLSIYIYIFMREHQNP